jgi:hypothetical protein
MQEEELNRQKEYIKEMRPGSLSIFIDLFKNNDKKKKSEA